MAKSEIKAGSDRRKRLQALVSDVGGYTHRGLSAAIGKNYAYIWQHLKQGRPQRLPGGTIDKVADALGLDRSWVQSYLEGEQELPIPKSARKAIRPVVIGPVRSKGERALPIFGRPTADGGGLIMTDKAVEHTIRPPVLADSEEGYGVPAPNDDMDPRYRAGDILYVNPLRPPRIGGDVIVIHRNGLAQIGLLLSRDTKSVTVSVIADRPPVRIPMEEIGRVEGIVGVEWR